MSAFRVFVGKTLSGRDLPAIAPLVTLVGAALCAAVLVGERELFVSPTVWVDKERRGHDQLAESQILVSQAWSAASSVPTPLGPTHAPTHARKQASASNYATAACTRARTHARKRAGRVRQRCRACGRTLPATPAPRTDPAHRSARARSSASTHPATGRRSGFTLTRRER